MKKITRYIKERHEWAFWVWGFFSALIFILWVVAKVSEAQQNISPQGEWMVGFGGEYLRISLIVCLFLCHSNIWNWLTTTIPNYIKKEYNIYKEMDDE